MATKSSESPEPEVKGPDGPAGDGGATPKSRPDYQYQWPANPEPSEAAKAKAKEDADKYKELHG
jgi:hypothetical protein